MSLYLNFHICKITYAYNIFVIYKLYVYVSHIYLYIYTYARTYMHINLHVCVLSCLSRV